MGQTPKRTHTNHAYSDAWKLNERRNDEGLFFFLRQSKDKSNGETEQMASISENSRHEFYLHLLAHDLVFFLLFSCGDFIEKCVLHMQKKQ